MSGLQASGGRESIHGIAARLGCAFMHICYVWCMRVTMNFDDELLRRLKKRKAKLGLTVTAQVQDAVRMYLANCEEAPRPETDLPVFHGSGVLPGIDLNNSAALLDVMEGLGDSD